jgi:hypothetical protein
LTGRMAGLSGFMGLLRLLGVLACCLGCHPGWVAGWVR